MDEVLSTVINAGKALFSETEPYYLVALLNKTYTPSFTRRTISFYLLRTSGEVSPMLMVQKRFIPVLK